MNWGRGGGEGDWVGGLGVAGSCLRRNDEREGAGMAVAGFLPAQE